METLQGLEREVARLQAEVVFSFPSSKLFRDCQVVDRIRFILSGGSTQKRGRRGEKKEFKPGGALQSHRAGGKMKY